MSGANDERRFIPSVDKLLATDALREALARYPRWAVLQEARRVVEEMRSGRMPIVTDAGRAPVWLASLGETAAQRVETAAQLSLRRVLNATGVVLHTNMGRALLAPRAVEQVVAVATRYSNLELNLDTGERGKRYDHVRELLCALTGAEDAIVTNNNAAAVMLCLSALAAGKEVVTSRGELVEIGGSFRLPEIMKQSGCRLVEVGTTNRTHLVDYERAITPETALLLKVHTSNFRVVGFAAEVSAAELSPLARERGIPLMKDLGSGCLVDLRELGLPHEPTVQESLSQGIDLVTFSGDKLLGGPQLGVIAGRAELVARLEKHQLLRALRVDKMTLAAFEATLRIYRDSRDPAAELPILQMLKLSAESIRERAERFASQLGARVNENVRIAVVPGSSQVGAGSAPGVGLPTFLISLRAGEPAQDIEVRLRSMSPAVMVRVQDGALLLDLRTIHQDEEPPLLASVAGALAGS